jgi:hypothetical protein
MPRAFIQRDHGDPERAYLGDGKLAFRLAGHAEQTVTLPPLPERIVFYPDRAGCVTQANLGCKGLRHLEKGMSRRDGQQ